MNESLTIGIAAYGGQQPNWWVPAMGLVGSLAHYGINFHRIITANSMATDGNRNLIVRDFLQGTSDWLLWIDTDNIIPMGGVRRLLDTGKTFVSGLYYLKGDEPIPCAYYRNWNGTYRPIESWNPGEILPIDMAGMGCCLTHRNVFEEIEKQYTVLQNWNGAITAMHKEDIKGNLLERPSEARMKKAPVVMDGTLKMQMFEPDFEYRAFPHFALEYGRTEDVKFYEMAARAGHPAWLDTSVEAVHLGWMERKGDDFRKWYRKRREGIPRVTEYLDVDMQEVTP